MFHLINIQTMKANPDCKVAALSALLTSTMPSITETVKAIEESGLRKMVKIMIGRAHVTQSFADQIGADGYSEDAASAV
jgi:methanogenic corrinoid protein MtbC1